MNNVEAKGAIWDMDGVLVHSAPFHFKAWQKVFQERSVSFTEEDFKKRFGQRNDAIIRSALGESLAREVIEEIAREKEETFRRLAAAGLRTLPGVVELLRALRQSGFRVALSSSAPMENIQFITGKLDIKDCFDVIVSGHEVKEGKPSPEGFLVAAARLGISPERCVVFEDSLAGVEAARRAGMRCMAVTTTHPKTRLSNADLVVDSLESVTVKDIENLLNRTSIPLPPSQRAGGEES